MEQLKSAFSKMMKDSKNINAGDNMSYTNYTVKVVYNDSTNHPAVVSTIEIWQQKKLIEIKSTEMEVYQDEKDAFMVLPSKKLITRANAVMRGAPDKLNTVLGSMQDSLFKNAKISSCIDSKVKGYDKIIMLDVNERTSGTTGISRYIYYVNTTELFIKKIKIIYKNDSDESSEPNGLSSVEYVINQVDYSYKGKKLNENVQKKIMKTDKLLADKYSGYQFVDNRTKN